VSFYVEISKDKFSEGLSFQSPKVANGEESNCSKASYNVPSGGVKPNEDWSQAYQLSLESTTTYPICTLTFDLAWHKYSAAALKQEAAGVEVKHRILIKHWVK
jgi:hypothetical protein